MGNQQSEQPVVARGGMSAGLRRCLSWVGWACLPSFRVTYVISLGVLIACVTWILFDSMFRLTLSVIRTAVYDAAFPLLYSWALVPRIAVLVLLSSLGAWSTCVVAFRLIAGKRGGRSVRSWMLATALCAAWLSLWMSYGHLNWWGLCLRVHGTLPRFEATSKLLKDEWPTKPDMLSFGSGKYGRFSQNALMRENYVGITSHSEELVHAIVRTDDGVLRFLLEYAIARTDDSGPSFQPDSNHPCCVEYHPAGSTPASFQVDNSLPFLLENAVHLRDSWYLVRYELSLPDSAR